MKTEAHTLSRRLESLASEAVSVGRHLFRSHQEPETTFVLYGHGRSGSTLLVSLIDRHADITCRGEILNGVKIAPLAHVKRERLRATHPCWGFKLLNYQLMDQMREPQIAGMRMWLQDSGVRVFYLNRSDILAYALSNIYARARGAFHSTQLTTSQTQMIDVDPAQLLFRIERIKTLNAWDKTFLKDLDHENINYEKDLATPDVQQATLTRVLKVLGRDPIAAQSALKPVTPRKPEDFVRNWSEVLAQLRASAHADVLDQSISQGGV